MRDDVGPEFSEEFIREVVESLATLGEKMSTRRRPEVNLHSAASVAINLEGVPIAEAFGTLGFFFKPSESKKFWESDLGQSIIRYIYLILLVAGHHHTAGVTDQKNQQLIELLAKQSQEFRLHEISPQFQPTPEPEQT